MSPASPAEFKSRNIMTDDEPLAGYRRCYVADPFDNRMELLEPE